MRNHLFLLKGNVEEQRRRLDTRIAAIKNDLYKAKTAHEIVVQEEAQFIGAHLDNKEEGDDYIKKFKEALKSEFFSSGILYRKKRKHLKLFRIKQNPKGSVSALDSSVTPGGPSADKPPPRIRCRFAILAHWNTVKGGGWAQILSGKLSGRNIWIMFEQFTEGDFINRKCCPKARKSFDVFPHTLTCDLGQDSINRRKGENVSYASGEPIRRWFSCKLCGTTVTDVAKDTPKFTGKVTPGK